MKRGEHAVDRLVVDRRAVVEQELGGLHEALRAAKDNRGMQCGETIGLAVYAKRGRGEKSAEHYHRARGGHEKRSVGAYVMLALLRSSSATVSLCPLLHAIKSGVLSEI